jgi:hypothetical protein
MGDYSASSYALLTWRKGKLAQEKPATGKWEASSSNALGSWGDTYFVFDTVDGLKHSLMCQSSGHEAYDADGNLITVDEYSMTVSTWQSNAWRVTETPGWTDTENARCQRPPVSGTVVLS